MSVEETEKVVRKFLSNNSPEVLSIKGKWGVGKTYFWKELIKQAAPDLCREKYSYVSLFGISCLAELKATICETLVHKTQLDKGLSVDNFKQNFDKLAKQWGWWRSITKLRTVFSHVRAPINLEPLFFFLAFREVKNALICIDDFERKGDKLTTKEVLGFISLLKEERSCKIVLILNDANFDDESKQDFEQFREKVVDVEVRFSPTSAESAALVFTSTSEIDTQLSSFTNALQISNIRILHRIKRAAGIAVPLLRDFDPQITRAALQTLALFGWSYYAHKHDANIPSYQYVTVFGYHLGGQKTEQQQGWDAILQKYNFKATDELDVALGALIENGFADEDLIKKEADKIQQRLEATSSMDTFNEAWALFYTFDKDEDEVVRTFDRLLRKHVMHVSSIQLNAMVFILRELNRNKLASELIDFYIGARRKNGDKAVFDISRNLLFGEKIDEEVERKFNMQMAAMEETPTIESALAHLAKEEGWNPAQEEVLASATPDDFCRIFKSVTGKTLHSYVNASLMFGRLGNASERQMAIAQKAREALLKIADESPINKIRVKRYGISTEDQPRLPL